MSEVEWWRNKIRKPWKLKILMKIFFLKQCFFLNSKPDAINLAIIPFDYCYWFEECENLWQKWFVEHYVFSDCHGWHICFSSNHLKLLISIPGFPICQCWKNATAAIQHGLKKCCSTSPLLFFGLNPLSANPTKWSDTLKQFVANLLMNCLSVFDHFVKLVLKGLTFMFKNF